MDFAKYPSITVDLERKIRSGFYRDKIPIVTDLMLQYNVSRQTIVNAVKPLIDRNILITKGILGTVINKRYRHPKKRIGIVSGSTLEQMQSSSFILDLSRIIEADGHIPELVYLPSQFLNPDIDKLLPKSFHAFLFISSSLSFPAARYLQKQKIPFVSCNYAPLFAKINFVEFDTFASIRSITAQAVAAGYSKIALFFPGRLEGYKDYILDEWNKIKKDFQLPFMPCDKFQFDRRDPGCKIWYDFQAELEKQAVKPEVIINWVTIRHPIPDYCLIIGRTFENIMYPPNVIGIQGRNQQLIIYKGYELLLELISAPVKRTVHRFYEHEIELLKEIPKRKIK